MNNVKLPDGEPLTMVEGIVLGEQNVYGLFAPSKLTPVLQVREYRPGMRRYQAGLERVAADPDQPLIDFLYDNAPLIATGESYRYP